MEKSGKSSGKKQQPVQPTPQKPAIKVNILVSKQVKPSEAKAVEPQAAEASAEPVRPRVKVLVSQQKQRKPAAKPAKPVPPPIESLEDDDWTDDDWVEESGIKLLVAERPPKQRGLLVATFMMVFWLASGAVVLGGAWTAFWLVINPGSVHWLSWVFPEWRRAAWMREDAPRSMNQLRAEAAFEGLTLGNPMPLSSPAVAAKAKQPADLLVPVFSQRSNCDASHTCTYLSELRVYRPQTDGDRDLLFKLVDRLGVTGPSEFFALEPLADATGSKQGSTRRLPLTQINTIEGKAPDSGFWFLLSGSDSSGSNRVLYGQVGHYDSTRSRLDLLIPWTSPTAQPPRWKPITNGGLPELLVDQTIGLEPRFLAYRVKQQPSPNHPIQLELISLAKPVFQQKTYENALFLAENGLWTPALKLMEAVKQRRGSRWSITAQAQMDVIALHAAFTKAQAEVDRASPIQHILAQVIDGRWGKALSLLQAALRDGYDLADLLKGDSNRLRPRIEAALKVNPNQLDVQTLGGLMVYVRQGRDAAIAWLQQQNHAAVPSNPNTPLHPRTQQILRLLDNNTLAQEALPDNVSQLMGSVVALPTITPTDWNTPDGGRPDADNPQGTWYRIQVAGFHNGRSWQRSPFNALSTSSTTPRFLWNLLGLENNPAVEIITWDASGQPLTVQANITALRLRNGVLHLLAQGEPLPEDSPRIPPLAFTNTTLQWVEPETAIALAVLNQQQPTWTTSLLTSLTQELGRTDDTIPVGDTEAAMQEFGAWSVELVDLTGNQQPEAILKLNPDVPAESEDENFLTVSHDESSPQPTEPPKTLIFSDQGQLIYSELGEEADQRLMAIAELPNSQLPTLIVRRSGTYTFQRWSAQNRRFERAN